MKFQIENEKDAKLFVHKFPIFAAVAGGSEFVYEIMKYPTQITICYFPKKAAFEIINQSAHLIKTQSFFANHTLIQEIIFENRSIINAKLKRSTLAWVDRHIFKNEPVYYVLEGNGLHFSPNKTPLTFSNIYNVKANF